VLPVSGASRDAYARKLFPSLCYLPSALGKQGLRVVSAGNILQAGRKVK